MAKDEKCPKCGSTKYAVATDKSGKHYCSKCSHVWVPGQEAKTADNLKKVQAELVELKAEVSRLRAKLKNFQDAEKELLEIVEPELFE